MQPQPVRVRPERTTLAVVLVLTLGALPLGLSSWWFAPVWLVPAGALVWVLRARVVADDQSLEICNGLSVRRLAWDDVAGFRVPDHGPVRLLRHGKGPLLMTALNRHDLTRVLEVTVPA